jgi:protein involved in polysaccharide export with SLBB domain
MDRTISRLGAPLLTALVTLWIAASGAAAQLPARQEGPPQASRADLERMLQDYQSRATSSSANETTRNESSRAAAMIRARLEEGDFRVGDRITLSVAGEPALSDTFVVRTGPVLNLPVLGDVPLNRVLHSELEAHLRTQLGRYFSNPDVHAESSVRVMVSGAVGRNGFYTVPTTTLLSDVLMLAGGPANNAKLSDMRIMRDSQPVWKGEPLRQALTEGSTLDQLSFRTGDEIFVPERASRIGLNALRGIAVLIPTIAIIIRAF